MSNKKTAGPAARDSAEWNNAWATLSKLATARQMALGDLVSPLPRPIAPNGAVVSGVDELLAGPSKIDHLELATAISEIEQASAALRAAEPALETWVPQATGAHANARRPWSVWALTGTVWLLTALAVVGVAGAIIYLLI